MCSIGFYPEIGNVAHVTNQREPWIFTKDIICEGGMASQNISEAG